MPEQNHDDLPPLGQPNPPRGARSTAGGSRSTPLVAAIALAVGLLGGIPIGLALEDEAGEDPAPETSAEDVAQTSRPTTSTTAAVALPDECVDTIRSAQQALVLLDEGVQSLGELDLNAVEEVLADIQGLREGFARRAQECLESRPVGTDG